MTWLARQIDRLLLHGGAGYEWKGTTMSDTKYPDVHVDLSGEDGNAFAILGRTQRAMKRAGVDEAECKAYYDEATSGDYDHLIQTTMRWVDVS